MERIPNWNEIKESGSKKIQAGGYIGKIASVSDVKDKQYLLVNLDIADGEHKNYYEELMAQKGFWALKHFASYKEKAQGLFKHFISSIEKSNSNYTFDFDETTLVGKLIGIVIGYEEYVGNDGAIKTKAYVADIKSVEDIKSGNYEVPELIKLTTSETFPEQVEEEADLPF